MNLAQAVASCLAGKHPSNLNQAGSCDQALTLEQYCHYNPFFILPVGVFSNTAILARFTKILITFILTIFLPSLKNSLANIYPPLTRCLLLLAHWQPVTIIRFSILAIFAGLRGAPLFRYYFCFHLYGKFDKTVLFATLLLRESRVTSTKVVIKQLFNDKLKFISFKPRISTRE